MDIARFIAKLAQVAAKFIARGLKNRKTSEPIETAQVKEASKAASTAAVSTPKRLPPMKPPKPSRECIHDFGVDGRFMLCGDFVETKSRAGDREILYVYSPDCDDDYIVYNGDEPYFMITSGLDELCRPYENFVAVNVDDIIKIDADDEKEFYAEINYHGDRMALYNYTRYLNDIGDKEYFALCVVYGNDYVGTEYEKHFLNVLKEAAETYQEIVNAE